MAQRLKLTIAFCAYLTSSNAHNLNFESSLFPLFPSSIYILIAILMAVQNSIEFAVVVAAAAFVSLFFRQILRYACFHIIVVSSKMSSGSLFWIHSKCVRRLIVLLFFFDALYPIRYCFAVCYIRSLVSVALRPKVWVCIRERRGSGGQGYSKNFVVVELIIMWPHYGNSWFSHQKASRDYSLKRVKFYCVSICFDAHTPKVFIPKMKYSQRGERAAMAMVTAAAKTAATLSSSKFSSRESFPAGFTCQSK